MKNKTIIFIAISTIVLAGQYSLHAVNQYYYLQHPETPGAYQTESTGNNQNVKAVPFTPIGLFTTSDSSSHSNEIGYYWDSKDTDNTLLYPGKARIGNDQYNNVVAVDSKNVKNDDPDKVTAVNDENVLDTSPDANKKFDPDSLIRIGTFMRKNDPVIYYLYGAYLSTVVPDPTGVETL